ncbi:MAG: (E)-4-hydroxy-3-methylbut-2-enyl-diphosphate synthase [Chitinophagaceae bacterium]
MQSTSSFRLPTREVRVGNVLIGSGHPICIQTMTTTDTLNTEATVAQSIRCIKAGAELVRITAPSKTEAENLQAIKDQIRAAGFDTPLVADIHFTPNAAEIAARIIEKVRVNPGNYVDKKKFAQIDYTDAEYDAEIVRIKERFMPLVLICKEHGTAMRIGTNHGSLSDRIMSRYGDTALGMVESAMEFLRIARSADYHQIILSMKSSNPMVMVEAYRLLVKHMGDEFGEYYPLHLGVTEAGDGMDGRVKSSIGIGILLAEGIGDTIRVSLTEEPEFELPVCREIVAACDDMRDKSSGQSQLEIHEKVSKNIGPHPFQKRSSIVVKNIGGNQVPVVVADYMHHNSISPKDLLEIGYHYSPILDKWNISDGAADYLFTGDNLIGFSLPGTLGVICNAAIWKGQKSAQNVFPLFEAEAFLASSESSPILNFVSLDASLENAPEIALKVTEYPKVVLCIYSSAKAQLAAFRKFFNFLENAEIQVPVIIAPASHSHNEDRLIAELSIQSGALFLEGKGNGIWLMTEPENTLENSLGNKFLNELAFSILQATRTRISKTEYISCPSCGRTLFDLQETTAKIRAATAHLKGLKIAVMGCIVNGPGEMADADFGYVGSGPGKITLYKSKEVVKRNVPSEIAVDELIKLLQESGVWVDAPVLA